MNLISFSAIQISSTLNVSIFFIITFDIRVPSFGLNQAKSLIICQCPSSFIKPKTSFAFFIDKVLSISS